HLDDFDPNDPYNSGSIEFFQFADGSIHSYGELLAKGFNIAGTPDADQLFGTAVNHTIHALGGDDLVDGGAGNDQLFGDLGNDSLFGGDGDDHLYGGDGVDVLDGDAGTDILEGGNGNDVYLFALGDGQDTVVDSAGADTVSFGAGITTANLRAARSGNDLVFLINGTADRLTVQDWFVNAQGVAQAVLGDGIVLDHAGILDLMRNAPPVLAADTASAKEDATLTAAGNALANDFDPEGRTLRVTNPGAFPGSYGPLSLASGGSFSYTLNNSSAAVQSLAAGQTVTDTFAYTATDDDPNGAMSSSSTITVNVAGTNDAPVTAADHAGAVEDQTAPVTGNVLANDSDVDNGTVLRVAAPGTFTSAYGTLTLAVNGDVTYTLNNAASAVQALGAGVAVLDRFSYAATDGIVSTPGTIDVTITGRNDAPVLAIPIPDASASPNSSFALTLASSTFTDADAGDVLTWSASLADGTALPSWLAFDAGTHTFSGRVPKTATGYLDVLVAGTDRSAAAASDVFRLTFGASTGGGGGSGGGGGGGGGGGNGGGGGSTANQGVGNGQDAPPPGQSYNFNDGAGTGPGNPGAKGGNGYTPHGVAPIGPAPASAVASHPSVSPKAIAAPPGLAAGHGDGQLNNNGQHNGIANGNGNGNGNGNAGTPPGGTAPQTPSLDAQSPRPSSSAPQPAALASIEPSKAQFGDVARYFAQLPAADSGVLTQRQIAQRWAVIGSAVAGFAGADGATHDAAADSAGFSGDATAKSMGWGYAGSTGDTAGTRGLPAFQGLSEGFGKLG
ncbi:MAG: putative Ig domain-containing protein, partial [Caulobacter sp.]|nr:putative Ig domain-containing protein [Vitreoscilla sp.]